MMVFARFRVQTGMPRQRARLAMLKVAISGVLVAMCFAIGAARGASQAAQTDPQTDMQTGGAALESLYAAALRSQKNGDMSEAAGDYRAFLSEALREVANSHAQIGDYGRASALFDEALTLNPDSLSLRQDYAGAALEAGDLKRAEALAKGLLKDYPNAPKDLAEVHEILGRTLHLMNQDQDARNELEEAAALNPSLQNEYDLALVCLDLDDDKCAAQIFGEIESSVADSPAIHMLIGRAYGNSDFTPLAVAEFEKAIAEDPHYPNAHYCVAAALLAAGDDEKTLQKAEEELKEELANSPNDFLTYAALGKIEASYHRYPEAEKYLKRAIVLNPKNPDAFLYLGQMYFDSNRLTEAEADLRQAIKLTTDPSRNRYQIQKAHFLLGRILMQQHHEDEAHAEMKIAQSLTENSLKKDRNNLSGMLDNKPAGDGPAGTNVDATAMALAAAHTADPIAAAKQKAFEKELTPALADSYNDLGAITASEQNYADALKYFEQARVWSPSMEGLDYNIGRAAFSAAKFSEAIPPLTRYLRTHPQDSSIRGPLAMSEFMTQNYRGCIDELKGAGEGVTSIPQMQYIYAESLVKIGEVSSGTERLEGLEKAHPEIAEVHQALGEVWEVKGDCRKAIGELDEANKLNPTDEETHFELDKAELKCGNILGAGPSTGQPGPSQ
jgi:tetratricopeptide (TPR) repeat protein